MAQVIGIEEFIKLLSGDMDALENENKFCAQEENKCDMQNVTIRQSTLEEAMKIVLTNREQQYGDPEDSFTAIKNLWSAYMGVEFSAKDVAIMMSLLKIARIMTGTIKKDNWVDAIGYLACGAEIEGKRE